MVKSTLALAALVCAALAWPQQTDTPELRLKEEKMILEYSATDHVATVRVEGESESELGSVELLDPHGARLLALNAERGSARGLSSFKLESQELDPAALFADYPAGRYVLRARSLDGRSAVGGALLSHALTRAPFLLHPHPGSLDVPTNLTVVWGAVAGAEGYTIDLEQDENDGLSVHLPAGTQSFQVPLGVLAPGTLTHLELGALAPGGNRTLVEAAFTTR